MRRVSIVPIGSSLLAAVLWVGAGCSGESGEDAGLDPETGTVGASSGSDDGTPGDGSESDGGSTGGEDTGSGTDAATDTGTDGDTGTDTGDTGDTGDDSGPGGNGESPFGGSFDDGDDPSVCTVVLEAGANAEQAVADASPGDVVCLRAGDYNRVIVGTSGQEGAPITLRAYPGERHQARLVANGAYSIRVDDSNHVHIEGLWLDGASNQGLYVNASDHVIARFNRVTNVGQECMRFKYADFGAFAYNEIETCGTAGPNGEGIYVGSGEEEGDDSHGVSIVGNDISDTEDEGIELKGSTYDCLVEGNRVHDLTCRDGGGIVVTSSDFGANGTWDTGHVVRGNLVWNVTTSTSFRDGNGINIRRGARVYNNVTYGNQHYGIRVDDKWGQAGTVEVFHNTACDNADGGIAVFNDTPVVQANNLDRDEAGNLACASTLFVDAPGGNYRLNPGTPAVDGAVDAGISVDLDGAARPAGAGFDFGAFEYQP